MNDLPAQFLEAMRRAGRVLRDVTTGAADLREELRPLLDGRGGGKPELAQGSGSNVAAIPAALAAVDGILAAGA